MAILIHKGKTIEVPAGSSIIKAAEAVGVIFGCKEGLCEVCKVKIVSGEENLNEPTQNEHEMMVEKPFRLTCQCEINKGTVEIHQEPLGGLYSD
ncbi:MAG TPA: 2Fe-2S iron-sulfur cluster-binding protein [Candidatus Nanoarchaeia archaeon]|nr:2Fe-2S iron-sulfur cluster-binding protein [Candidatus Nanoarchaeia archaeon]